VKTILTPDRTDLYCHEYKLVLLMTLLRARG
jgi:hypothetical protein